MSWLLLFVPAALGLEWLAPERHLLVFFASALAIVPLAGWISRATGWRVARHAHQSASRAEHQPRERMQVR
jgi:hypothetical protein